MDDLPDPIRFPVDLGSALEHMRHLARRRHGFVIARRTTRRAMRKELVSPESLWALIERLGPHDFERGPTQDHHCEDREVWVFAPMVNGRRMYLKIAFRRVPEGPESALVIWSFHQPRFPMKGEA